jgi:hypothetical protein
MGKVARSCRHPFDSRIVTLVFADFKRRFTCCISCVKLVFMLGCLWCSRSVLKAFASNQQKAVIFY